LQKRENKEEEFEEERRREREEEKQRTTVHEERREKEVSREETKVEEDLTIPIIKLEKLSIETRILKLNFEVPEIKKEELVISVPFVKLEVKPSVVIRQKFNDKLVIKKQEEILPTVPIIRLETLNKVQFIQKFDQEIRRIKEEKIESPVPFFVVEKKISLPEYLGNFNSKVLTISRTKPLKEETEVKKVEIEEEKIASEEAGAPSGGEEEIFYFFKFSFGSEGGKIRRKSPKIILFKDVEKDSYINFLENVCLRIYEEIEGGEPKAEKIEKMDDLNKIEIERWLEAGGKIVTINLDSLKNINDIDQDHLRERLEETYSSKLGFIIFTTRDKETFEAFKTLLQNINLKSQTRLNIAYIEARPLPLDLIKLSSGMIDLAEPKQIKVEGVDGIPTLDTFDSLFNYYALKERDRYFEEIKNEEDGLFKYVTVKSEEESELHFNIKVFIVRYWVNKLRKEGKHLETTEEIKKFIQTEEKIGEKTPDVRVVNNGVEEFYEVETLFGEGEDADTKIVKTIDKYTNNEKVNIVMDNFGFLLHLKDLERIKKDKKHNKNVEFYTLDLKNNKLISIEEFKEKLKELKK